MPARKTWRTVCSVAAAAVLAMTGPSALAQSSAPPPPPASEGAIEFAFIGTTGNSSTQTIGLNGDVTFRPGPWQILTKAAWVRNRSDGEVTASQLSYLQRVDRALSPRASAFGEYSFFRDRFAGVSSRNTVTAGLAYKVLVLDAHTLVVDGGVGYLNERRLTGESVSSAAYNGGLAWAWTISPSASFKEDLRLAGTFSDARDWRASQSASLTTRITAILSLKVSSGVRYTHEPPPGFRTTDTVTSVALAAKWGR